MKEEESIRICALTGAYGYVGSHIRHALEENGWRVIALSRRQMRPAEEILWSLESPCPIATQLREYSVSALVHAAWDFTQIRDADIEFVNVRGSVRLFEQAAAAGVHRIVFISSMSAYPEARSLYGRAKMAVEHAATNFGAAVLRPGLVYGDQPGGVFGSMQGMVNRSSLIPIIGDGSCRQYLVHDADVGEAVVAALNAESVRPEPVCVAHPEIWSFRRLVQAIARLQNRHVWLVRVPWWFVFCGLKLAEMLAVRLAFRSDSVISLVYPNLHPEFNCFRCLGVQPRPFY
jgi:nucleoside-diphosphate-sugar epimerase